MSDSVQVYNIGRHIAGDILKHILLEIFFHLNPFKLKDVYFSGFRFLVPTVKQTC